MANLVISCAQGDVDIDDKECSCLYSIHSDADGDIPVIDLHSFKYKEWHDRRFTWQRMLAPSPDIIIKLEERIQLQLDDDQRTVEANQLAVAEGWQ
jgi:hypothetical protein